MTHVEKLVSELPDHIKERFMRNFKEHPLTKGDTIKSWYGESRWTLEVAIIQGFSWNETPEGSKYWAAVSKGITDENELHKLIK